MPKIKYKEFNFRERAISMIQKANEIIADYAAQGFDLTLRQLYYQFVSRDLIPNTQKDYKNLGSIINDARLAGLIDWEAIEVQQYDPPPNPAKITDSRANGYIAEFGNESWELDALEPAVLEALVRKAIEGIVDENAMAEANEEQDGHRATLKKIAERFEDVEEFLATS